MSQKVIWGVVVVVIIAGLLWWAGIIPGLQSGSSYSQSAAAANANNPGVAPSVLASVNAAQKAAADLDAAGSSSAKLAAAAPEVASAVSQLAVLLPQLSLAVNVSAATGNAMDVASAAMKDASRRLSTLNNAPVTAVNVSVISRGLLAIVADISTANTALTSAKNK